MRVSTFKVMILTMVISIASVLAVPAQAAGYDGMNGFMPATITIKTDLIKNDIGGGRANDIVRKTDQTPVLTTSHVDHKACTGSKVHVSNMSNDVTDNKLTTIRYRYARLIVRSASLYDGALVFA